MREELEHARGLGVGRRVRRDAAQQRLGVVLQDRQLKDVRRVEDGVGVLLEREDVAVLAAADALPAHDGALGIDPARAVVADHAAEHAVVGSGDVVVFVDRERSQRRSVYTEHLRRIHTRDHRRI